MKVTKFFDTKLPLDYVKRGETENSYNIGNDLYMPYDTEEFRLKFLEANQEMYDLKMYNSLEDGIMKTVFQGKIADVFSKTIMTIETNMSTKKSKYNIYHSCQIPTGVGFEFPKDFWGEVRSKSSNFKNGFTVVHGTIDMNYTYGVGVQLIPLNHIVTIESEQKIAQIIIQKSEPISFEEVDLKEFESSELVSTYRNIRTGGFGSTGKFDTHDNIKSIK